MMRPFQPPLPDGAGNPLDWGSLVKRTSSLLASASTSTRLRGASRPSTMALA